MNRGLKGPIPQSSNRRVYEYIQAQRTPVSSATVVAAMSGMSPTQVYSCINNLRHAGKIVSIKRPGQNPVYAMPGTVPKEKDPAVAKPNTINKMAGDYIPPKWVSHRPGSMDAFNIPSKGF